MHELKEFTKAEAEKLGFCLCGFTDTKPLADYKRYTRWLENDSTGTMGYLKREDALAKRMDFHLILPDVQSICVLAVPMGLFSSETDFTVASYAHYKDYHESIKPIAEALAEKVREQHGKPFSYRICIDSAPVLERSLAVRAGLGWIGKSSMLVNRAFGSALFLCEIFLSLPFEADEPYNHDGCGSCHKCAEACPNHCIDPETRTIRADRCISYLTIEHKGEFTPEQSMLVGNHLFGCDECLRACPWNARNNGKSPLPLADVLPVMDDYGLSDTEFKEKFKNSPVLRTKAKGLRRNIEAIHQNISSASEH